MRVPHLLRDAIEAQAGRCVDARPGGRPRLTARAVADLLQGFDDAIHLDALLPNFDDAIHLDAVIQRRIQARLAHPLHGEVLRDRIPPLRARSVRRALARCWCAIIS